MAYNYYYSGGGRGGFLSSLPPVTKNLIIINVIFFFATLLNGNLTPLLALYYPTSPNFHVWQIVTHMFMHGGFWHIFFNM